MSETTFLSSDTPFFWVTARISIAEKIAFLSAVFNRSSREFQLIFGLDSKLFGSKDLERVKSLLYYNDSLLQLSDMKLRLGTYRAGGSHLDSNALSKKMPILTPLQSFHCGVLEETRKLRHSYSHLPFMFIFRHSLSFPTYYPISNGSAFNRRAD